jgi:glucose-1-phosphate adenylyltransferase
MDYAEMIRQHELRKADVTIAVQEVPWEDTSRFGLVDVTEDMRIKMFQEKPKTNPVSNLASLGIYVFDAQTLLRRLEEDAANCESVHDFGKNILPAMLEQDKVYAHLFDGYWRDVGTIESFWQAHMEMLDPNASGLNLNRWDLRTNCHDIPLANFFPATFGRDARVCESVIGRGCVIQGTVERSVLFPGVIVGPGARITDSVIMPDSIIRDEVLIEKCVIDKGSIFERGCTIGHGNAGITNDDQPEYLHTGITLIGENVLLPQGTKVGKNVLIYPGTRPENLTSSDISCGQTIKPC